jgi:hypothetical protein
MTNDKEQDRGEFAPCPIEARTVKYWETNSGISLDNAIKVPTLTHGVLVSLTDAELCIKTLKRKIHELVGELIGYKKIVADQDALLLRNAERIIDLQTHIENLEGEDQ